MALTASLALTAAGWVGLDRNRSDEARSQFERRTETAEAAVRSRMLSYEQVLRSGAARIASSPTISAAQWHGFITNLGIEERFPGIQSIGFAERVKPAQREAHTLRMRAAIPNYEIR
ncbi:MAG: CHASE domain-containing protein, partial [Usitatibacter sp.]